MKAAYLLDVNVLLALFWPRHSAHESARRWFLAHRSRGWATCPVTQAGFVRLVSHPAISLGLVSPADALRVLEENCADARHEFWPAALSVAKAAELAGFPLEGHRLVTDAYLVGLAAHHGGKLASFDRKLAALSRHVAVVPA